MQTAVEIHNPTCFGGSDVEWLTVWFVQLYVAPAFLLVYLGNKILTTKCIC